VTIICAPLAVEPSNGLQHNPHIKSTMVSQTHYTRKKLPRDKHIKHGLTHLADRINLQTTWYRHYTWIKNKDLSPIGISLYHWHARQKHCLHPTKPRTENREHLESTFWKRFTKIPWVLIGPIVSSVGSVTESLSQFVDKRLQPLIKGLPSNARIQWISWRFYYLDWNRRWIHSIHG